MDDVFKALADPGRRRLLDALNERDAQSLGELCAVLSIARQSVSRHLAVLEAAGLVTTTRDGRQKLHHLNADPIVGPAGRWIGRYRTQATWWDPAAHTAPAGEFTYTTYIRTTPERLWHAVTNSDNSVRCMGHGMESDWIKGSVYGWVENGQRLDDPEQLILESDPYQRLAFTFPALTGAPDDESAAGVARSRVTFDLEPFDDQVELTVTHRAQQADGAAPRWATERWPFKLSALKTELEQVTPPDR